MRADKHTSYSTAFKESFEEAKEDFEFMRGGGSFILCFVNCSFL